MNFKNWPDYRDKCQELNLYTKANLKELGLKPKKDAVSEAHRVYTGGSWKEFKFYKIEDTEKMRSVSKSVIRDLEIIPDNLCQSLYIINKSAKKSRDTKKDQYSKRNYGIVARAKGREINLYDLKNDVINKMIDDNILNLVGFHIQQYNNENVFLLLYKYNDYSFHVVCDKKEKEGKKYLGTISGEIPSEVTRKTDIKFNEAVKLLEKYVNKEQEKHIEIEA